MDLKQCIENLEDLNKNVSLDEIYLNGLDSSKPYSEGDRLEEVIEALKKLSNK